jgi:ferredoxin/flavodoxin---NADP+ reductase
LTAPPPHGTFRTISTLYSLHKEKIVTATLGTAELPLRVAIIGAGPAGFYAAEALLKTKALVCRIDFFNRLPTPFGLVREGVAPDHQSIKAVTRVYDRIAGDGQVRYYGNVTFGQDLQLADLRQHYDAIIYAVGAQSDRRMGIAGEDLAGSYPATIFVGWYNGHPDYCELQFDLSHERAIVVGNGNVAMDVTRMLVTDPDELATTDIADYALAALRTSQVREVVMLGRRGPAQAAFTSPELKEFGELKGVDVIVDPADLELDEASAAFVASDKTATKNLAMLREYAARGNTGAPRRIVMRFLVSPAELLGAERVESVRIERNILVAGSDGSTRAKGTGEFDIINAGLVLRSVGYKGAPLAEVPYDPDKGTIPNLEGRVTESPGGPVVAGQYVVGWAKRGPSGVIGTNKPDAGATIARLVEDLPTLALAPTRDDEAVETLLRERQVDLVTYKDWAALDAHETAQGAAQGRPRVKVTNVSEMLAVIHNGRATP